MPLGAGVIRLGVGALYAMHSACEDSPVSQLVPSSVGARRVVVGLVAATGLVFAGFVASFGWHRVVSPVPAVKDWFDIGGEANLPTWWNSTLLVLIAVLALSAAIVSAGSTAERRAWWVVAAAATYLSIDEATELHERLTDAGERTGLDLPTYAWLIPGVVLAAVGSTVLVVVGRSLPRPTGPRLGAALAAYGFAALGLEALTGWIRDRFDDSPWFTLGVMAEEGLEMLACVSAIGVILDRFEIERDGRRLTIGTRATME